MKRRSFIKVTALGLVAACNRATRQAPPAGPSRDELTRLIQDSPRDEVLDRVAERIARGATFEDVLGALSLAAARNVRTHRMVSTPQHILLCLQAVRTLQPPDASAPGFSGLLWAIDHFKGAQAEVRADGDGPMPPMPSRGLPPPGQAIAELRRGLDVLDAPLAERAVVAAWRAGQREPLVQTLLRFAARDFRDIGHKPIHVAHGLATLDGAGWYGAEETLRSIALTCGLDGPEDGHDLDSAWPRSQELLARIGPGWEQAARSDGAVTEMLSVLRVASQEDAAVAAVEMLGRGVSSLALWDALCLGAAEILLNNPRAVEALHAVTATHAARTISLALDDEADRKLALLQAVARVVDFRNYAAYWAVRRSRPGTAHRIDALEPVALDAAGPDRLDELFAGFGGGEPPLVAAGKTLALLAREPDGLRSLVARAIVVTRAKASDDTHDFKLVATVKEDGERLAPRWRPAYAAACAVRLRGAGEPDSAIGGRVRDVLGRHGLPA